MVNKSIVISVIIASIFIVAAFVADKIVNNTWNGENKDSSSSIIGKGGSDHSHASLLIFADDIILNSEWGTRYMLKDNLVHFENNDNIMIHKHAKGITLPYFLQTLGFKLTNKCLSINSEEKYCEDENKKLNIIVNGKEIKNLDSYELKSGDRILIDFSSDDGTERRLKYNSVPVVPEELLLK